MGGKPRKGHKKNPHEGRVICYFADTSSKMIPVMAKALGASDEAVAGYLRGSSDELPGHFDVRMVVDGRREWIRLRANALGPTTRRGVNTTAEEIETAAFVVSPVRGPVKERL